MSRSRPQDVLRRIPSEFRTENISDRASRYGVSRVLDLLNPARRPHCFRRCGVWITAEAARRHPGDEELTLAQAEAAELRRAGFIAELASAISALGPVVMVVLMVVRPT